MSDLNDPLRDSYIGQVVEALKPYTAELTTAGFDPASRITQLGGAGELIQGAQKLRESAEKAASDAMRNQQAPRGQFYRLAPDTVSLVEGLVSKDHPLTQKLRGLRSDLIGHQNPAGGGARLLPRCPRRRGNDRAESPVGAGRRRQGGGRTGNARGSPAGNRGRPPPPVRRRRSGLVRAARNRGILPKARGRS